MNFEIVSLLDTSHLFLVKKGEKPVCLAKEFLLGWKGRAKFSLSIHFSVSI